MLAKICLFSFCAIAISAQSFAVDIETRLEGLADALKKQQKTIEEQQKTIDQLKTELAAVKQQNESTAAASRETPETGGQARTSAISGLFGGSIMTNPYISFSLNTNFYSSSVNERNLGSRGIPGYTTQGFEQKKGFNLSEGELFLFAPVDPYFNLYATIPFTEEGGSLEEAYFVTTALPEGLQVKGGKFKSGFSRFNSQHPHAWDFADAPLLYRGFLGNEGLIEKGVQVTYLPTLPFYTLLGIEVLQGQNEVLFNKDATGGPHGFTAFVKSSLDFGDSSTVLFGPYVMGGQTRTDTVADDTFFRGNSTVYGFETVYKWKPSKDRSVLLQAEYMLRNQNGTLDVQDPDTDLTTTSRFTRSQDGMYVQGLYQLDRWRFGLRWDRLNLFRNRYSLAGEDQGFGANPWRIAGAVEFNPSEFSRLRLQYNHDRSGLDGKTNHEVIMQLILGIGAHAAHPF